MSEGKELTREERQELKRERRKKSKKSRKERREEHEQRVQDLQAEGFEVASSEPMTVEELETAIQFHRELYYKEVPTISDDEFDRLVDLLRVMEPNSPMLAKVEEHEQIEAPEEEQEEENPLVASFSEALGGVGVEILSELPLGINRLRDTALLPTKATERSACYDVYASEDAYVQCGQVTKVPTGIHLVIPEGHRVSVRPRSGLAVKHGVTVVNSPGTIDEDYPGELFVALTKLTWGEGGPMGQNAFYEIKAGDRIAQICLEIVEPTVLFETDETATETDREGGFGSTGR